MPPIRLELADDWFAALVNGRGQTYGLVRRIHVPGGIAYESWTGLSWVGTAEGAGYFTGAGGITNAVIISKAEADRLAAVLATGEWPFDPGSPALDRFMAPAGSLVQEGKKP